MKIDEKRKETLLNLVRKNTQSILDVSSMGIFIEQLRSTMLVRKIAAIDAAYCTEQKAFEDYRNRVIETLLDEDLEDHVDCFY